MQHPAIRTAAVLIALCSLAIGQDQPATENALPASSLNSTNVIGRLGIPLGVVAEVDATIVSGAASRAKGDDGRYFLRIESLNGDPVSEPPTVEFTVPKFTGVKLANNTFSLYELKHHAKAHGLSSADLKELEQGYVGSKVKLAVYETGGFSGLPSGLPEGFPVPQSKGFHFSTHLVVLQQRPLERGPKSGAAIQSTRAVPRLVR